MSKELEIEILKKLNNVLLILINALITMEIILKNSKFKKNLLQ
jgi:hypothetical protein